MQKSTMKEWFGSSGGGLPGVLSREVQGAFCFRQLLIVGVVPFYKLIRCALYKNFRQILRPSQHIFNVAFMLL
jgi:hypothetical protein